MVAAVQMTQAQVARAALAEIQAEQEEAEEAGHPLAALVVWAAAVNVGSGPSSEQESNDNGLATNSVAHGW